MSLKMINFIVFLQEFAFVCHKNRKLDLFDYRILICYILDLFTMTISLIIIFSLKNNNEYSNNMECQQINIGQFNTLI